MDPTDPDRLCHLVDDPTVYHDMYVPKEVGRILCSGEIHTTSSIRERPICHNQGSVDGALMIKFCTPPKSLVDQYFLLSLSRTDTRRHCNCYHTNVN